MCAFGELILRLAAKKFHCYVCAENVKNAFDPSSAQSGSNRREADSMEQTERPAL